jgi:hypothetical protein
MSLQFHKQVIVAVILLVALVLLLPRHRQLQSDGQAFARTRAEQQQLQTTVRHATQELESLRHDLSAEKTARQQTLNEITSLEQTLNRHDPELRWIDPPAVSPEWNPESPYVWLPKGLLPVFAVQVFDDQGALRPEVATVLCIPPDTLSQLNQKLADILSDFRAQVALNASRVDQHLPGGGDGLRISVELRPLPDKGAALKQEFQAAVRAACPGQRSELILKGTQGWFSSSRDRFISEAETISVTRHPDGTFNVETRGNNSWTSSSGMTNIQPHLPLQLLPFFPEFLDPGPALSGH